MSSDKVSCILVGAGRGARLGKNQSKALIKINNIPLFYHTLKRFLNIKEIEEIILVLRKEDIKTVKKILKNKLKKEINIKLTTGGKRRQDSVKKGLKLTSAFTKYVLIHDIARPFIKKNLIRKMIKEIQNAKVQGLVLGRRAVNTLKEVNFVKNQVYIKRTLDRKKIFEVYTPQIFEKESFLKSYFSLNKKEVFDDSQIFEHLKKMKIKVFETQELNIKITYPQDLVLAKKLL